MGHIQKRGDRKYQARWLDHDGKERAQTFTKKGDAERHITKMESAKDQGAYVDTSNTITVTEYARQWAAARPHRPNTSARVKSLIDIHIAGTSIGGRKLATVRPSEVQAWVTDRAQRLSPGSLRLLVALLRSVYAAAVHDRLVASSPAVRLSLPRQERERIVPLAVTQVQA